MPTVRVGAGAGAGASARAMYLGLLRCRRGNPQSCMGAGLNSRSSVVKPPLVCANPTSLVVYPTHVAVHPARLASSQHPEGVHSTSALLKHFQHFRRLKLRLLVWFLGKWDGEMARGTGVVRLFWCEVPGCSISVGGRCDPISSSCMHTARLWFGAARAELTSPLLQSRPLPPSAAAAAAERAPASVAAPVQGPRRSSQGMRMAQSPSLTWRTSKCSRSRHRLQMAQSVPPLLSVWD
jgi:hypothetical protein